MQNRTKRITKKNKLAIALACLGIAFLAIPMPTALACYGAGCKGGGLTIDGVPLDTYLGDRKIPISQVEAWMGSSIRKMHEADPELEAAFLRDVHALRFYYVDKPLDQLSFTKALPFATDQTMVQVGDMVFVNRAKFNALESDKARGDLLVHERFQRNFLMNQGVNLRVTPQGIWDATYAITKPDVLPKKEELRRQLAEAGFVIATNEQERAGNAISIEQLAHQEESIVQPIDLGGGTIRLKDARAVISQCMAEDSANPEMRYNSVLGKLTADYYEGDTSLNFEPGFGESVSGSAIFNDDVVYRNALRPATYSIWVGTKKSSLSDNVTESLGATSKNWNQYDNAKLLLNMEQWGNILETSVNGGTYRISRLKRREIASLQNFPQLSSETVDGDRIYDKKGALNPEQRLKSVNFIVSLDLLRNNGMLSMENAGSHIVLDPTVNTNLYMDCIRQGIAKRVVKGAVAPVRSANPPTEPSEIYSPF